MTTREYWVKTMLRVVKPVLGALAEGKLRATMPIESGGDNKYANFKPGKEATLDNGHYAYLEAFGRSLCGVGPWLEVAGLKGAEAAEQEEMRKIARAAVGMANRRSSPDYIPFHPGANVLPNTLCDAAAMAHGLLRSWDSVWCKLDREVQQAVVANLKSTRALSPWYCNWLLFSVMIEAFLCKAGEDWDRMRVDYGVKQFEEWYMGDGVYGDGPFMHWDYYNSYVIHPMLLGIVDTIGKATGHYPGCSQTLHQRAQRYAAIQERLIAPDGTFPPIGRSLAYRMGAFHCLADIALQRELPAPLSPAQVRCGLTAVIKRTMEVEGTFDAKGWLTVGFCGHQPSIGEDYMCTGAVYLCSYAFLPLGLLPEDEFWAGPDADWTAKGIWAGGKTYCDHALKEVKHEWMGWR